MNICPEHGIAHYSGDPGPHTHGEDKPCLACFAEYIEFNHGLPTSPMDLEDELETGIHDKNPSLTALIRDQS
jgi:hypothetical protein